MAVMGTLTPNKWYPVGTFVDFTKYGFHTDDRGPLFTIKLTDGTTIKNCVYEGYDDLFSTNGQIAAGVEEFMLQAIPTYTEYKAEMEKHHANLAKAG
jgi:hypothetical protein